MRREDPDLATYEQMELYAILVTRQNRNLRIALYLVSCALASCLIIGGVCCVALN